MNEIYKSVPDMTHALCDQEFSDEFAQQVTAARICKTLIKNGHEAYFVGGCVRDKLLGRVPKDYDIATSASPEQVQAIFPDHLDIGAAFGVIAVQTNVGPFEVATFRSDGEYSDNRHPDNVKYGTAQEDAMRRDFTINALFMDAEYGDILDFVGGQKDLKNKILRTVGDPHMRFQEDPLRMLRAVRFEADFDFDSDLGLLDAIVVNHADILKISPERIRDELVKILHCSDPAGAFRLLQCNSLLSTVLPEIQNMMNVKQPPEFHPEGDVMEHTFLGLEHMENPSTALAMAVLLHDVGKPDTQTFEDRIRFSNHDVVGAKIAQRICERLKFSNSETERVVWLVQKHMRLRFFPDMRQSKKIKLFRHSGFEELMELCRIDCAASHGDQAGMLEQIREEASKIPEEILKPKPLINGHDLTNMGYTPGPLFSKILEAVETEQLEGNLTTHLGAEAYVLRIFGVPTNEQ